MEKLTEILNQELEVFNRFLGLLDQQHKQIISREIEALSGTNTELDMLSGQARLLEKKRVAEVSKISEKFDLSGNNIQLRDLLPRLDRESSHQLRMLRESILGAHKQAEEKSLRNKKLIERSRQLIAESMKIITARPAPVYQKPGPNQQTTRDTNLVNRSV